MRFSKKNTAVRSQSTKFTYMLGICSAFVIGCGAAPSAVQPPKTPTTGNQTSTLASVSAKPPTVQLTVPISKPVTLPTSALIHVPPQDQNPQLPNGCEVTSLSMLLSAVGHPVDKLLLAKEEPRDTTPRKYGAGDTTVFWGNPNVGFVGDVTNATNGYGIYHGPLTKFLNQILPNQAIDLTGKPFQDILAAVASGKPVVLWTTATFEPTQNWISWMTPEGRVRVTLDEHAVLLVGYDKTHLYVNNPLNGMAAQQVDMKDFIAAWKQLGEQALTVKAMPTRTS